jgi:hypothetical protein
MVAALLMGARVEPARERLVVSEAVVVRVVSVPLVARSL